MLYNPDLYKEPSLRDMADFCDSKNPEETYNWTDAGRCACAQYSHTKGMEKDQWLFGLDSTHRETWQRLNRLANGEGEPNTFGALAKRLRVYA